MAELAVGHVSIVADTSRLAPGIKKALGGASGYGSDVGNSIGSKISSGIGKTLKAGAIGVGTAVGGTLAGSIAKGLGRLNSLDQASAKLEALGNSGQEVDGIMSNALASVKGTAFGIGEAAGTAATMVASGVKPGKELESVLTGVADSAAIAGVGMDEMGLIWGKVAAKGKLDGETMAQMLERQIPIYDILSEKTGVASEDIADMVSKGEIDFQTFSEAMNDYVGGGAKRMGETVQGAMDNVGAAMGRFGEALLAPAFSAAPALLSSFGGLFDKMTDAITPASEELGKVLTPALENFAGVIESRVAPFAGEAAAKIGDIVVSLTEKALEPGTWEKFGDVFTTIKDVVAEMWPSIESLAGSFLTITQNVSVATWQAFANVLDAIAPLIESVLVPLVEKVAEFAENNPGVIEKLVMAFLGFKGLKAIAGPVGTAASTLGTLGGAVKGVSGAFKGASLGQGLLNLMGMAKSANPILAKLGGVVGTVFKAFWKIGPVVSKVAGVLGKVFGGAIGTVLRAVSGFLPYLVNLGKLFGTVIRFINPWVGALTLVTGALTWFFTQTELGQQIWETMTTAISEGWQWLKDTLLAVWEIIKTAVFDAWNTSVSWLQETWAIVTGAISTAWTWLKDTLTAVWEAIKEFVINAWNTYWSQAQANFAIVTGALNTAWTWIKNQFTAVWNVIKSVVVAAFEQAWNNLRNNFQVVTNALSTAWNWLKDRLHATWSWIDQNVIGGFRRGMEGFKNFFKGVVDGIKNAWNTLRSALAKPINFMINTVYNGGILKAWETIRKFLPGLKEASPLSSIPEHATGGRISGPGTGTSDDVLMWGSNGEHMLTAREVQRLGGHGHVYAMRQMVEMGRPFSFDGRGGIVGLPRRVDNRAGDLAGAAPDLFIPKFAKGGEIRPLWESQLERGHAWAQSRSGRPYVLGGSAEGSGGTDCSGFMSGIANVIQGGNGARQWATMAFNGGGNSQYPSGPQGFVAGLKANTLSIGVTNGGTYGGHTAGTLGAVGKYGTVNVESGGAPSMVKYGAGAAGADDPYFRTHYHLPIGPDGAFVSGGSGGISPEAMQDGLKKKVSDLIDKAMDPILSKLPVGPPEWKNIPKGVYDKGKKGMLDTAFDVVGKLGDKLASVWTAAGEVKDLITGTVGDAASWVNDRVRSIVVRDNGGLVPSGAAAVNFSGKDELMLPPSTTALFNKFLKDMPGVAGALERSAVAFQAAAEELGLQEQARKSAEDYAAEQASGLLGTFGLEGLVPLAQKAGANAWEAYQASPYDVGVNGQTVVVEYVGDENDREWKMLQKLDKEVALLKAKRKPKASAMTRGGVQ